MAAKILIASGATPLRINTRKVLESKNYNVVRDATNQRELVVNYRAEHPDIVILDLNLAENTIDIDIPIKNVLHVDPQAKIIALASNPDKTVILKTMQGGAKHFLPKPVDNDKLIDIISRLL